MSALTSTVYTDLFQCLEGWKKYNSVDKYCPHGFVSASGGLKKYVNVPHCTLHMFVAARDGVERCVAFMGDDLTAGSTGVRAYATCCATSEPEVRTTTSEPKFPTTASGSATVSTASAGSLLHFWFFLNYFSDCISSMS